jgi:hypothetical protein
MNTVDEGQPISSTRHQGQIELPAKIGDREFDDRQHETMQPVPTPHHVRQDGRE